MTRRLVLVGGGHAHLHVLRDLARRPLADVDVVLVSPERHHHYSGMVPGYLQRQYRLEELQIDLAALARRAAARFVQAAAERVRGADRQVVAAGESFAFDACSVNVGSGAAGDALPGVHEHAFTLRPMSRAVLLARRIEELEASATAPLALVVVGSGAGGVEVAFALAARLRRAAAGGVVTLVGESGEVLPEYAPAVRRRVARLLRAGGVATVLGARVESVSRRGVRLAAGGELAADLVVWVAGAAPPPLLAASDLPVDARGFFLVDRTLRAVDGAPVWGAGDCVSLREHPDTPRAGVYAVREGPVLSRNLRRALHGARPRARYRPQRSWLSLVNTGDGAALLRWHALLAHGRAPWCLKDAIDRRFVRGYADVTK